MGSVSVREAPPEEIFLNNCMQSGVEIVARKRKNSAIKVRGEKGLILPEQESG